MDLRVKTALVALTVNGALVLFKALLWKVSGSTAIMADAIHSLSDLMVSIFVIVGLKLTQRGERQGLANWRGIERVVELVVGGFILYTGCRILAQSVTGPSGPLRNLGWVILGEAVCAVMAYAISTTEIRIGRATESPSLIADGYHLRIDVYSAVAVAVGLSGTAVGIELESVAAVVVSLLVAVTGLEIIVGSVKALAKGAPTADYFLLKLFSRRGGEPREGGIPRFAAASIAWLRRDFRHAYILVGALVLVWLGSGFYTVRHGEKGIVFRFGSLRESDIGPGLHFHAPYPVEKVVTLSDRMVQRVEIGFRTSRDSLGNYTAYQWESPHQGGSYVKILEESLIFTGDESIADVNSVVQYRISHPARYLLAVENAAGLVRSFTESAQRSVVGRLALEEILTVDRREVEVEVKGMVQDLLDRTGAGIEVISVKLQDVHPPLDVVDAFRDVASSKEDMHATINRAQAYHDSIIPETRGQAEEMVTLAKAEKAEAVEHATGESKKFLSVLEEYQKNRQITELRMYLETMEKTLPGIRKFLVEPEAGGEPIDLRFFNEQVTPP